MRKKFYSLNILGLLFVLVVCTCYIAIMNDVSRTKKGTHVPFSNLLRQTSPKSAFEDWARWNHAGYCVSSIPMGLEDEHYLNTKDIITLCTQGTPEFLHHIREQCRRWEGPISIAVYAPEEHFLPTQDYIGRLIHCDPCVKRWVSWHAFYANNSGCTLSLNHSKCTSVDCGNLVYTMSKKIVPYPINVARNIARMTSKTTFVLSLDIELYPNRDITPRFLRMLSNQSDHWTGLEVWVLPVFEVQEGVEPPMEKKVLRRLFESRRAVSFHKFRCHACHKIPHLGEWMARDGSDKELKIVETVKRDTAHKLQYWEPFFIGTRQEPLFDPRLTWNGKQNKMQMAYEMCLMKYDFHILDDAFLVHSPGINRYNASREKTKARYIAQNNRIFSKIKHDLNKKYPNVTGC